MQTKKTFFNLTVASVTVILLFTGFGCKGLSTSQQQLVKPVTLEYWTVFDDVDALRAQIAKFRELRPYITVNVRQLRSDELYPRLIEALAEDRGPDIISIRDRWLKTYVSKLAPMPAAVKDTTVIVQKGQFSSNTTVNSANRSLSTLLGLEKDYVKTVKDDVVVGGKIYGLPLSLDTMAVFYNKDILDASGVSEPPKNWEEFQASVKKITKYDKKTNKILQSGVAMGAGNNIPGADDLLYVLFKQSGVNFTSKSGQALFNARPQGENGETPAMSVMNFYTDFANPTRDTYSWDSSLDNALDRFVNGSVGFVFGYSYHYPLIQARAPQLNFGVLPMFQLNPDKPVNVANYWIQTVVGKSKNQNEAWNLIDFLAHSKATKEYLDTTNRPTALRAYVPAQKENVALDPFVQQILIVDNWYHGSNYEAASKAIDELIDSWLLVPSGDNVDPVRWRQGLLDQAASKVNQTL